MRKLGHFFILILGAIFILTACSQDNQNETEQYDSIADEADSEIKLPKGVKIIENPNDFKPVTLDQSYHMETDTHLNIAGFYITTDGNSIYIHHSLRLEVLDIKTKSYTLLCNLPQCEHDFSSEDCKAYFNSQGIQYFQGSLYTVAEETIWEGDEVIGYEEVLYRISLDGNTKEKICTFATIYKRDIVTMADSNMQSCSIYWTIHRGYIYYVYDIGTSGLPDNTFYNNMSNYICRMKIGKNEEREYIMPLEKGSITAETDFWGYGSYVYFCDIKEKGRGDVYRFNTESKEVEKLPLHNRQTQTYTAWEDALLYTNIADDRDTGLYRYNRDGSTEKILDFADFDKRFGTLSDIFLFRDSQYIYATSYIDKEAKLTKCIVLDGEGNYISSFNCCVEENEPAGLYSITDEMMLMPTPFLAWYYFDKEELKTGEIHPVKLIDSDVEGK